MRLRIKLPRSEMYATASCGIWIEGWKAVTQHERGTRFEDDRWALYHSQEDFSETEDLADKFPDRVRSMVTAWNKEAERNNVLPLEDDLLSLEGKAGPSPRESTDAVHRTFLTTRTRLQRLLSWKMIVRVGCCLHPGTAWQDTNC